MSGPEYMTCVTYSDYERIDRREFVVGGGDSNPLFLRKRSQGGWLYWRKESRAAQQVGDKPDVLDADIAFADLELPEAEKEDYMYMYSRGDKHFFKHIDTRKYITALRSTQDLTP